MKMKIGDCVRQGDVLMVRVHRNKVSTSKRLPVSARGVVLAEGEVTGHAHTLAGETVTAYAPSGAFGGKMVVVVDEPTPLVHEEHKAIPLVRGAFDVVNQWEYEPDQIRRVAD